MVKKYISTLKNCHKYTKCTHSMRGGGGLGEASCWMLNAADTELSPSLQPAGKHCRHDWLPGAIHGYTGWPNYKV